jgi:hypothetical protein
MPHVKKASKTKVPEIIIHRDGGGFIVEVGSPFSDVIRYRTISVGGGRPLGWTTVESHKPMFGGVDDVRFFWPCSSPYNFARYLSLRVVVKNRSVQHWKHGFMTDLLASKMLKLIRPSVAMMDHRAPAVGREVTKHIAFDDWKMRCYDHTCAIALHSHLEHGTPLRPALILSSSMEMVAGIPMWKLGAGCVEDNPLSALEYHHGDASRPIYDSLVRSRRQLRAVDIGAKLINNWSFSSCPSGQKNAEAMAFAFVSGMHACRCCIGDDAESFCRRVSELISETPRKGRRSKLHHVDVCINNCMSQNCGKVSEEPIL